MRSLIALLVLAVSFSASAFVPEHQCIDVKGNVIDSSLATVTKIMHYNSNRPQIYIAGSITKVESEDHSGLPHQKFTVKVSNDINLEIVSNLDFGRIPLVVGQQVSVCGEYLHVGQGMVHWTHFDPHGGHADGFTILNGILYGDKEVPVN
ncbi:MAG: DUF3465 domain-containing protein [Bacteriovorax sp.]|nr:DUF3465 domain-containing protein [Bacteriovorax sp.]